MSNGIATCASHSMAGAGTKEARTWEASRTLFVYLPERKRPVIAELHTHRRPVKETQEGMMLG